jgi:sulfofructose kinase
MEERAALWTASILASQKRRDVYVVFVVCRRLLIERSCRRWSYGYRWQDGRALGSLWSRLGNHGWCSCGEVAVFGRIGDDTFGQYILDEFASTAVNTDGVETVSGAQSQFAFCVAHEATGKRTIFYKHGSMARLGADDVDLAALTDCRCLLIDSHHPHAALAAAQRARSQGVPVVLDAERVEPHLDALLAAVDYPVLPDDLVTALGGGDEASGIEQIMHHRPAALVVTRGADGADLYSADEHLYQPAFAVPQVVDTTGAGDVFHGAFAYALALGHDLQECLKLASATAALSTTALGGRGHLPSLAETRALSEGMCGLCSG